MGKWGRFLRKDQEGASQQEDQTQSLEPCSGPAQGELGHLLRQTREEKAIPLEEVEEHTRIRQKYLLALEEARYNDLPTPGHIHGFLRNYALYLGLDMEEVEARYAQDQAAHRRFEPRIFHPKDITLIPRRPLVRADLVLSIVIVILLAVLGWVFWQYGWPMIEPIWAAARGSAATATPTATRLVVSAQPSPTPTRRNVVPTATTTPVPATTAPTATSTSTAEPTPTATSTLLSPLTLATSTPELTLTPLPTPTRTEGVVLQVRFTDRVWLQVTVDGQELPGGLFEAGEEKEWVGQDTIYMVCGNAGGVEATVNGQELGLLGERAQVVAKTWGPEGEVTPTPAVEGTPAPTPTIAQ